MAVKKQPDSNASELTETANDWFRQFLKHLEIHMVETGESLGANSDSFDHRLAAMRAVMMTLIDSGTNQEELRKIFGLVAFENAGMSPPLEWNREQNKRRFELIDREIQGTLSPVEQFELASLTQRMREHVDSEANLSFEGARKLHQLLTDMDSESVESKP